MRSNRTTLSRPGALAACIASILFTACAATSPSTNTPSSAPTAQADPSGEATTTAGLTATDVECHNERVTGSHMIQTVCTTAEQRREMAAAAKQWMRTGGRSGGVSKVRDSADPRDTDEDD